MVDVGGGLGARVPRFYGAASIRRREPIELHAWRDPATGQGRVIVTAPGLAARDAARVALGELARVHALAAGPNVPGVAELDLDGAMPWVALACDAVVDLEAISAYVRKGGERPPMRIGSALSKLLMETLARVHDVVDPTHDRPVCLGALSTSNVLFSAAGAPWLVGFGLGLLADTVAVAPEVAAGEPPTPSADLYAITVFVRALMSTVRLPDALTRAFAFRSEAGEAPFAQLLAWSFTHVLSAAPAARASMADALANVRELWRLLEFEPDAAGWSAWIARLIASGLVPAAIATAACADAAPSAIAIGAGAAWVQVGGTRHDLAARPPLRRVLLALAGARHARPGTALRVDELIAAGWPDDRPERDAGANRVYVALTALRKLGLDAVIQRWDGGYRLDPAIELHAA